ncbi:PPOX class F420-dependent oxidoreductase [Actinomycetospora lutea]|uniref:PPOX class F420-dependent oxidoreductase n=1 Tax=Actinomycetospora lutea TaxID=663604 RepID=UPI00236670A5|nr:PPOX class F420-dependent oxidoreductase [Actinomycetospora lutea]MDD7937921.1 PPOX class F420-dependent oxidoreductase [Actinomycetospora lutea]
MSAPTDVTALGNREFVSLTTFRRTGEPVPTPVWVARDGDALVVITSAASGKVKRSRRDPRVVLRPCDRRGTVAPDAPSVEGRAEVVTDAAAQEGPRRALAAKYGLQWRLVNLMGLVGRLAELVGRGPGAERVILRLRN